MAQYGIPGPEMTALLQRVGSPDQATASKAEFEFAQLMAGPIRQGILNGNIADFFAKSMFGPGVITEYPLDMLVPGTEKDFVAYTIPAQGRIPMRHVEGDNLYVPTYEVGSSIDFTRKYARDARWDVAARAMQILEGSFVRKWNSDAFRTVLAAGYGNALTCYDNRVKPGYTSKRLVELMKTILRRRAGGNTGSTNRGKLTRLYMSPEALGDVRNWTILEVSDLVRKDIYLAPDAGVTSVFGVDFIDIDELGVGQEFQLYWTGVLGGTMPTYTLDSVSYTKQEIVIGLDTTTTNGNVFVNPVREDVHIDQDMNEMRNRRVSFYGSCEYEVACLDARHVLIGAI